jgi:small subunit ribosomal protein S26e
LARELKQTFPDTFYAPLSTDVKFYCVSCAVHRGIVKVRSEADRRLGGRLR